MATDNIAFIRVATDNIAFTRVATDNTTVTRVATDSTTVTRVATDNIAFTRVAAAAVAAFALAAATATRAEAPTVGGSVPSVLSLSLSPPSGFSPVAGTRAKRHAKRGERLYAATIELAVTATDTPTSLSVADGEASIGRRRGHLVGGGAVLSSALQVAAGRGAYKSLDRNVSPQLAQWSQPLAEQTATVRLRQAYRGGAGGLRRYHKLLLITVTAGGP